MLRHLAWKPSENTRAYVVAVDSEEAAWDFQGTFQSIML